MKTLRRRIAVLIAVASAASLLSCADAVGPTSVAPGVPSASFGFRPPSLLGLTLLACTPVTADSVSQVVGPDGGTINVGAHSLFIPWGALDSSVTITAVAPSDTINRVRLYPEGLTFEKNVYLTMSYANCGVLSGFVPKRIVYVDSSLSILDLLPSLDWFWTQSVTARLEHFSDYVVAW